MSPQAPSPEETNRQVDHIGSVTCGKAQRCVLTRADYLPWGGVGGACSACGTSASTTIWGFTECLNHWSGIPHNSVSDPGACFTVKEVEQDPGTCCITHCLSRSCQPYRVLERSTAGPDKALLGGSAQWGWHHRSRGGWSLPWRMPYVH